MGDNTVSVILPPNERWLYFAHEALRRYGEMVGFSPRLEEMCSSSVMEACEELVSKAAEVKITSPIELRLDYPPNKWRTVYKGLTVLEFLL